MVNGDGGDGAAAAVGHTGRSGVHKTTTDIVSRGAQAEAERTKARAPAGGKGTTHARARTPATRKWQADGEREAKMNLKRL